MKSSKTKQSFLIITSISLFLVTLLPCLGRTAIPQKMNYQGFLTDSGGTPINGTVQMVFSIYDVLTGGAPLWVETQNVTVSGGVYNANLGGVSPINLLFDIPYYLGVKVGTDPEMTPRMVLTSVGYAFRALTVENIGNHTHSATDITSGTISESRIDPLIARDSEVTAAVNAHALRTDNPHSTTAAQVGAVALNQTNSVTSEMIISGAVTDAKITGPISASKISSIGLNADTLDGIDSTGFASSGHSHTNFVDLSTNQTIGGAKTFSNPIASNVATGTAPLQVASTTMVANLNAETIEGKKLADLDIRYGQALPIQNPRTNALTIVDSEGDVGKDNSITIGVDGLPIISYYDATNEDLKVAKCGNPSCSSGNTITTVDSSGNVGRKSSITIGADGYPVVSYCDFTNDSLKVLKCGSLSCSSTNIINTVDSGSIGNTSIAIGIDGFPIIAYEKGTIGSHNLKVAKCGDQLCSSGSIINTLDTQIESEGLSIAMGADGLPVIAYGTIQNWDLKLIRCGTADCSTGNQVTILDPSGYSTDSPSITIGNDGAPIVAVLDWSNPPSANLKVVKCPNYFCGAGRTITTIDSGVGEGISISLGTDGLPIIVYVDTVNSALKIAKCGNAACTLVNTIVVSSGNVGQFTSVTVGKDGIPIISYYDQTDQDLKVVKCANQFCLNNWSRR